MSEVLEESERWACWEGNHRGKGGRGALYIGAHWGHSEIEIQPPVPLPCPVEYRAALTQRQGLLSLMPRKVLEGSEGLAKAWMGVWRKER